MASKDVVASTEERLCVEIIVVAIMTREFLEDVGRYLAEFHLTWVELHREINMIAMKIWKKEGNRYEAANETSCLKFSLHGMYERGWAEGLSCGKHRLANNFITTRYSPKKGCITRATGDLHDATRCDRLSNSWFLLLISAGLASLLAEAGITSILCQLRARSPP